MSRALMSSRAATAVCCSLLSRILLVGLNRVKVVLVNIAQNGGAHHLADRIAAGATPRELRANHTRGNRLRCNRLLVNNSGRRRKQGLRRGGATNIPLLRELATGCELDAWSRYHHDVRKFEDVAPAMPRGKTEERV